MNRRNFIKISALSAGGVVLGGIGLSGSTPSVRGQDAGKGSAGADFLHRTPTYCEICFWKCAGWVYKNDRGEIWKIIGNENDPHCNGRLCPRGTGGVGSYYDQDRLKTPLIRTGPKGKQSFRRASWDEALEYVARKLDYISKVYGPETVALITHGSGGKLLTTLMKAYGSDAIAGPSHAQCKGPRETAFSLTFGSGLESPEPLDIRDTRCLVLIGSHLGENMHNTQVQEMADAIDRGATIITVDPRFSTVAAKSKFWLPIKPATDIALLLAWIHVIINKGWYDKDYVEKYTIGFDKLKEYIQPFSPEWAYGITTLDPNRIRETAKEMANAAPAVIVHPGRHVTWYGDDTQRSRAIAILNALLGSWGRRGGFYLPEAREIPEYPHPLFPPVRKSWRDVLGDLYPFTDLPLANAIVDGSIPGNLKDFQYRGWIVNGSNLNMTMPDTRKTLEAIQHLELLMVIDTMPMEITGWADVVLPECTYLERYDVLRNDHHREPVIALRMPAAEPKYDSKPDWWITRELARKMGLGAWFDWKDFEEFLDYKLKRMDSSLDEMKRLGVKKYERTSGDLYISDVNPPVFDTPSGKIELYSTQLEQAGFDPLPRYTPHEEPPEGFYRLIYGRAPNHTFSRTSNNPNLAALMPENKIWVNPKVAANWQLKEDQEVWLKNQDGIITPFPAKVRITERIRWDSVYIVHGFGHTDSRLTRTFGKGVSDSALISRVHTDPIMGGTGMRGNFVTFITENPNMEVKA
ncbi:MAG TPA: molybdopterin-dependent oxidoreductase [Bacteroidales bacterium]|nr:molybdopterin-dependent oxidoreductase [Bacteroidales bacterium]HPS51526.1 molybdopterin-dependent oxidoreductase [Bacteroidales bacterium]